LLYKEDKPFSAHRLQSPPGLFGTNEIYWLYRELVLFYNADKELLARARHCPEAFGRLYNQDYPAIFNYCIRQMGDVELAQDITAETFSLLPLK